MVDHAGIEAAKFLEEVGQEFNDEPNKLALKLYAICQQLQQNGEEDSLHFRILSRALETVLQRYGVDQSILNSLHQRGGSGPPLQSEPSAFGGPSGLSGGNQQPDQIFPEERRTGGFGQYSNSGQGIGGAATRESNPRLAETVFSPPNLGELLVANTLKTESPSMSSPTPRNEPNPDSEHVVVGGLHDRNNSMDDLEQDLAVPVEGTPNRSAENVVVGTYAQDSTTNDFQQELAVPVEVTSNARGENGVVGELHALNSINDFQRDIAVPDEGTPPYPRGEQVVVGLHALNSSTYDFQEDVAVRVEGTLNPRESKYINLTGGLHALNSTDDLQEHELAVPFEGTTPNARGGNVVVGLHALNSSRDDFQQELAVPVDRMVDHKRPHEEATKRVETRSSQKLEFDEGDSLVCPICMEPWTNNGDHRICSLVCGHLFGKSCIKRWLRQNGKKSSRCPQCNKRAKLEDLRPLYVPGTLAVVDGEAQQLAQEKMRALTAENVRLKLENEKLHEVVRQKKAKSKLVQAPALQLLGDNLARSDFIKVNEPNITSGVEPVQTLSGTFRNRGISRASFESCGGSFQLQSSIDVHGGKVLDMDAESLTVIFSNKVAGCGNSFGLSKMSLLSCTEVEKIALPSGFGTIRDIRLSPSGNGGTGKYALVAFQGKKLSLISMESNNIVHSFSLQNPPWSCAWDPYVPYIMYSGLQNGALLMLDLRNTESPIATLNGLSIRPIHTLEVVRDQFPRSSYQQFGCREILSASNGGISLWNLDPSVAGSETARPQSVFSDTDIVCTSLVYESSSDTAAASFRRSPLAPTPTSYEWTGQNSSQPLGEASTADIDCEEPSHWIFSRRQESSRSQMNERIRLPWMKVGEMVGNRSRSLISRSAIIPQPKSAPRSKSLFACGDEGTNSVWLWDMKSLRLTDTLVPHPTPVLDIKNVQICNAALGQQDVLGCVSETTLQIYRRPPWSE